MDIGKTLNAEYRTSITSDTREGLPVHISHNVNSYPVRVFLNIEKCYMDLKQLSAIATWIDKVIEDIQKNQDPEALKESNKKT